MTITKSVACTTEPIPGTLLRFPAWQTHPPAWGRAEVHVGFVIPQLATFVSAACSLSIHILNCNYSTISLWVHTIHRPLSRDIPTSTYPHTASTSAGHHAFGHRDQANRGQARKSVLPTREDHHPRAHAQRKRRTSPIPHQHPPTDRSQAVVTLTAAALNHRDLFIRQHLYPGTTFGVPLLADGVGIVSTTGASAKHWLNKRVVLNPGTGWKDSPDGPEAPKGYAILGGTKSNPTGTLADVITLDEGELEDCPEHLSDEEAAALPLTGLTGWRAFRVKCGDNAKAGRNVLVTGIGGGVALMVLLFAVAEGCNVYVTSGDQAKIDKAVKLGAKGGVSYKEKDWEKKLQGMLPKERKYLDAIVDGAGGDVVAKGSRLLKVSCYPLISPDHWSSY